MRRQVSAKKAFTLIELIVVIAIIAILAAIIAPNVFRAIEKSKISKTVADMKTIRTAALAYVADTGRWPWEGATHWVATNTGNEGFLDNDGAFGWDGPYLEAWPVTQWKEQGTEFYYIYYLIDWDGNGIRASHFISIRNLLLGSSGLPMQVMQKLDEILDDGNVSVGKIQHFGGVYFDYCLVY